MSASPPNNSGPSGTPASLPASGCPVCGGQTKKFYRLKRHACQARRCRGCGFVWIDPPLRSADTEYIDHYEQPAYAACIGAGDNTKYRQHLENIERVVDLTAAPNRRALEIGSCYGHMLELLVARGFTVEGIELLQDGVASSRARGLTVHRVPFEQFNASTPFGLVLSTHVVEHLRDIRGYFQKTSELLAPGGFSILLTPNADATLFKLLRQFWAGATPDEHNLFLGFRAARSLASQYGFEVVALKTTGRYWSTTRGILAELYHMKKKPPVESAASAKDAAAAPTQRRPGRRDAIFKLIAQIESPFLTLLHKGLARVGRSDELLLVLRKK